MVKKQKILSSLIYASFKNLQIISFAVSYRPSKEIKKGYSLHQPLEALRRPKNTQRPAGVVRSQEMELSSPNDASLENLASRGL